jgi:tRNA-(ms[2]io[6]A)-hydroxylase
VSEQAAPAAGAERRGARRDEALDRVLGFLRTRTPDVWFEQALAHLDELLIDHANCEKKAAGTALSLLYRYVDKPDLLMTLSRLAREELRHFEQVHEHIEHRGIDYVHLSPSRYAGSLKSLVRTDEPARLVDTLVMGAIVEARSCERFLGLVEVLPKDLAVFYEKLLDSEARHFEHYLMLARRYAEAPIEGVVAQMLAKDAELISLPDDRFRFHSGPLAS